MSTASSGALPGWVFWVFLVRGSVALALGLALLVSNAGLSRLGTFVAVYWLIGALLTLRWAAAQRAASGARFGGLAGLIGLVIAIVVLLREPFHWLISAGLLLDVLGLSAIAMGLLRLLGGFHDDVWGGDETRGRYRVVVGALDLILGVALLLAHKPSDIRFVLVAWGLVTGTFLLLDALRLRRLDDAQPEAEA